MKFKPSSKGGGVLVELSPDEVQLPPEVSELPTQSLPVFNLRKILVPVDFSECSEKALQYAIPFAKQFGAEITLVHVIQYSVQAPEMILAADTTQAAKEGVDALVQKVGDAVMCRAVVRVGKPADEIVEAATQGGADLIILSTHGRSGLAHLLLGSTAEQVVRHAPCPVLVVREREHDFVSASVAVAEVGNRTLLGKL